MTTAGKPNAQTRAVAEKIRAFCLAFPETQEDHPWGHSAFKVRAKTFCFMGADESGFSISIKLRDSLFNALALPFTEPTHYGLGKHGWVTASFAPDSDVPVYLCQDWINESFREIAPKTVQKRFYAEEKLLQVKTSRAKPAARKPSSAK